MSGLRLNNMLSFSKLALGLIAIGCGIEHAVAQDCQTDTVTNTVPSDGTGVALQSYSYCAGTLNVSAYVQVSLYPGHQSKALH